MISNPEIETYCHQHSQAESAVLCELREYTYAKMTGAHMLSDILVGRLLQFLLQSMQARVVLDLGTFTGYSALTMAEALGPDGLVFSCDHSPQCLKIARSFFAKSEHGQKIKVFEGQVADCIAAVSQGIDFAFVDADKMQMMKYIDALYPKLRKGGMIVVDNVLWKGLVLEATEKHAKAIDDFNKAIAKDSRFVNVILPIRDGLNVMRKKG